MADPQINWIDDSETPLPNHTINWLDSHNNRGSTQTQEINDPSQIKWLGEADLKNYNCTPETLNLSSGRFEILRQQDASQCGPCSIINTLRLLNLDNRFLNIDYLRTYTPLDKRGVTHRNDDKLFWFNTGTIIFWLNFFQVQNNYSPRQLSMDELLQNRAYIHNNGNHFISFIREGRDFIRIDSIVGVDRITAQDLLPIITSTPASTISIS